MAMAALEGKLAEYGKVLQAMRNRIVALQEYVDSTQGMVKELHTVHGSVLMRIGALESSAGSSGNGDAGLLQSELDTLASKMATFELKSSEVSGALEGLQRVGDRLAALDARDGEISAKLASIGQTMPVIAGKPYPCMLKALLPSTNP